MSSNADDPRLDGFTSLEQRRAAHRPIEDLVAELAVSNGDVVLDLGSGSGALLEGLCRRCPALRPVGVECDDVRAARARERLTPLGGVVIVADLFDPTTWSSSAWGARPAGVSLLMPGRLVEARRAGREGVDELIAALVENSTHVVAYAYDDWLVDHGDLDGLAAAAGLTLAPSSLDPATGYPLWRSCGVVTGPAGVEPRPEDQVHRGPDQ